jgi:hypothetical protein
MSLEMAHKVIVPQKKIMSRSFLNSGTLIVKNVSPVISDLVGLSRNIRTFWIFLKWAKISATGNHQFFMACFQFSSLISSSYVGKILLKYSDFKILPQQMSY